MQVKSIAECSKRAFCETLVLHQATVCHRTFVLSIFEWPLKTRFTVFRFYTHVFLLVQSCNIPFSFAEHCLPKIWLQGSTPIFCLLLIYILELEACIPSKELVQIFPANEGKRTGNDLWPLIMLDNFSSPILLAWFHLPKNLCKTATHKKTKKLVFKTNYRLCYSHTWVNIHALMEIWNLRHNQSKMMRLVREI